MCFEIRSLNATELYKVKPVSPNISVSISVEKLNQF